MGSETWCGAYDGPNVGNEDIDIQYGYTGTRSHGVVVDFAQGSFTNINIENVESYHGEANGMTVYKECDVVLENIQVDSIHAGSQLSDDEVDGLSSPNLTPRACGVDIRPNTIVTINEDVGIISGEDIVGFDTCYDEDTIIDEKVLFRSEHQNKHENLGVTSLFSLNNMSELLIMVILSISILLYIGKIIMDKRRHNNIEYVKNDNSLATISEHTPLL